MVSHHFVMDQEIMSAVTRLDSKNSADIEHGWLALREHDIDLMPYFRRAYSRFKTSSGRRSLVFYATRHARISEDAFQLGLAALKDRSWMVRDRACGLLAYSLRKDALVLLDDAMIDARPEVRAAAQAASKAIRAQNHHLFADRSGSGSIFWVVDPQDQVEQRPFGKLRSWFSGFRGK